jgi:hypothetical protein
MDGPTGSFESYFTVNAKVVLCVIDPELAPIDTCDVPGGVGAVEAL